MKVEIADKKDIEALVSLRLAYLAEDHGCLDNHERDMISQSLPAYFNSHLQKDLFCYIVREKEEIVSCAFLLIIEKPMSPAFLNGKTGQVFNVYTKPSYRRRGYAKKIMERLLQDVRQMSLCSVELKATKMGYTLYQAVGFQDDVSPYHLMKWINDSPGSSED